MKLALGYVTSDHHFGHDKMAQLRGFYNDRAATEAYVMAHNSVVQDHHAVVFLGDVCMSRESLSVIAKLKGSKHLVLGNHDQFSPADYLDAGFKTVNAMLFSASARVIYTHFPVHQSYFTFRQADRVNLHGHLHSQTLEDGPYINCCLEHSLKPRLVSSLVPPLTI
jgi:calcineurin-like phosphoesterase family protein